MTRNQQPALTAFAIGMIGLGILALVYGDFAMVWQPVPQFPGRTAVAYASGVLMLLGGVGLMFEATAAWAARVLFPYLIAWNLLKVPSLVVAPGMEAVWLGFGELAILTACGWFLFARLGELSASFFAIVAGEQAMQIAKIFFAVWLIPIGLSHIFYVKATADLVPAWLPHREGWAYLTGVGHIAAGLGVLFGILPRLAAFAEAAMIGVFTLLVWAPKIVAEPKSRLNWTAFFISWAIAAGSWVVAQNVAAKKSKAHKVATQKATAA